MDRFKSVFVYSAIPEAQAFLPKRRSALKWLRNRGRRQYDFFRWRLTGELSAHYSTFEDVKNSNVGDIAVGVAVKRQITENWALPSEQIVELGWGDLNPQTIDQINQDGACFILAGSGYLHCGGSGDLSPLVHGDIGLLERLNVPVLSYGIGVNRLIESNWLDPSEAVTPASQGILKRFSERVDLLSVRDNFSRQVLELCGASDVWVVGDPALHQKVYKTSSSSTGERLKVGINFSLHGPGSQNKLHHNIAEYLSFLRWLHATVPCDIWYFAHSSAERFIWKMLSTSGVEIRFVSGPPDSLLSQYAQLDLHVCQMMHSAILASSQGVPTLNLGYDVKNKALFELLGLEQNCINISNIRSNQIAEALQPLLERRVAVCETLLQRRAALLDESGRFLRAAEALVWPT